MVNDLIDRFRYGKITFEGTLTPSKKQYFEEFFSNDIPTNIITREESSKYSSIIPDFRNITAYQVTCNNAWKMFEDELKRTMERNGIFKDVKLDELEFKYTQRQKKKKKFTRNFVELKTSFQNQPEEIYTYSGRIIQQI